MTMLHGPASSEYVLEGHPDKLCDLISDAIVDEYLCHDADATVGCEVLAAKQLIVVAGEISSHHRADIDGIVRRTLLDVGYDAPETGMCGHTCCIETSVSTQSPFLSEIVRKGPRRARIAASDQAVVFGFASRNTWGMIPLGSYAAKRIAIDTARYRRANRDSGLRPDGKVLVSFADRGTGPGCERPATIVLSAQHKQDADLDAVRGALETLAVAAIADLPIEPPVCVLINPPTGVFHFGGPGADSGLTGRKIVADTYGAHVPCGGGALSGKDPTKIDRSATYAARWVAKSLVSAGLADSVCLSLTYVIGEEAPMGVAVSANGSESEAALAAVIREKFDLRPGAIIEQLQLRRPIYYGATRMGHMGLDESLPWEIPAAHL
jgi:S-adenosylmethionine synthetase